MRRFVIPGLIATVAVALLALLVFGVSHSSDSSTIGGKIARGDYPRAPDYTRQLAQLNSSRTMSLAAFKGKVVVLNFYASWCEPCQGEAPLLAREQKILQQHGATIVGVTYEDTTTATEAFDKKYGISYPVLRDVNGKLVQALGIAGVPDTYVINRTGHIQAYSIEPLTQKWFTQTVMPLLDRKA